MIKEVMKYILDASEKLHIPHIEEIIDKAESFSIEMQSGINQLEKITSDIIDSTIVIRFSEYISDNYCQLVEISKELKSEFESIKPDIKNIAIFAIILSQVIERLNIKQAAAFGYLITNGENSINDDYLAIIGMFEKTCYAPIRKKINLITKEEKEEAFSELNIKFNRYL